MPAILPRMKMPATRAGRSRNVWRNAIYLVAAAAGFILQHLKKWPPFEETIVNVDTWLVAVLHLGSGPSPLHFSVSFSFAFVACSCNHDQIHCLICLKQPNNQWLRKSG